MKSKEVFWHRYEQIILCNIIAYVKINFYPGHLKPFVVYVCTAKELILCQYCRSYGMEI